jgi:SAM-dependent methyltransferase
MWNDVVDLREFYASPTGALAAHTIAAKVQQIWPISKGLRQVGIGYPIPIFEHFDADSDAWFSVMPSGQGVVRWTVDGRNLSLLSDESVLPFPDRSIDRLVLIHCLEGTAQPQTLLRECWRVLADGGRLLVFVANRTGLWARAEDSPFASGRPFSMGQILRLLRDNMFMPAQTGGALFAPPFWWRPFRSWSAAVERLGEQWLPRFAGLLVVEAEKQIYAMPFDPSLSKIKARNATVRPVSDGIRRI